MAPPSPIPGVSPALFTEILSELVEAGDWELPALLFFPCFASATRRAATVTTAGALPAAVQLLRGQFALLACVLNYRTTRRDMEILLEDVRQAATS